MYFTPGQTVLRRCWRGGRITFLQAARVVEDDARGLLLWLPAGVTYWRLMTEDGRNHHDGTVDELGADAMLQPLTWIGHDVLMWQRSGEPWSVWWFFRAGHFVGWYGNLEDSFVRWRDADACGIDFADNALDVLIEPDLSCRWKDEAEFVSRTGHPHYWNAAEAGEIRADGERLIKVAESGEFPFDGTWCDFRPDPTWPVPQRTPGWDRPQAVRTRQ
ncbi:hypothetical protein Cs7R123_44100 [Catellatospora sp. TT07R-123]|uniref:DUF402 domain-containing protein n=1 Tax=Catellatospora sp. TT07R-123 TaxID=2733863 RepID=UPI001B2383A1|nr:DUF402 domain-containing protein [Catellatospora sp. TT07R-123]GHJ47068.1 hypothetical protein Cs7R123_44100 [Catellatospora sp. TT07R-123]